MKIKRMSTLGASLVLVVSSLVAIGFGGVAHAASTGTYYEWTGDSSTTAGINGCTSNCWSVPGNWEVSTNGSTYTTATTAPNSTDNGGAGDNLVFDTTNLTSNTTTIDDISNLTVDTITSQGSSPSYNFTIDGQAFNLVNGLIDGSGATKSGMDVLIINNNITFTNSQNISSANGGFLFNLTGTFTIPSGVTLTFLSPLYLSTSGVNFSGLGSLILDGTAAGSAPNFYQTFGPSPSFSGSIQIQPNALLVISQPSDLGTASLIIEQGGQLNVSPSISTGESDTVTINNPITMAGDGSSAQNGDLGAIEGTLGTNSDGTTGQLNVGLTGPINLTGDTMLSSTALTNTAYDITGTYNPGSFTLGAVGSSTYYGSTVIALNGKVLSTTNSTPTNSTTTTPTKSTTTAPKTPDTGFGLTSDNIGLPIIGSIMIAGGLYIISRKLKSSVDIKRR